MKAVRNLSAIYLVCGLLIVSQAVSGFAQTKLNTSKTESQPRDGQRDFDFHLGTWKTHVKRLRKPSRGQKMYPIFDAANETEIRLVFNAETSLYQIYCSRSLILSLPADSA